MSSWEYFNGDFDYTSTPLGPIGYKLIIHTTSNRKRSWDQRGRKDFSVGRALQHYCCIQEIDSKTKSLIITDAAEYLNEYLTQPHVTAEDRMAHAIHFLSVALKDVTASIWDSQLAAIEAVQTIFANWQTVESLPPEEHKVLPHPTPVIPIQAATPVRYPTPTSKGGQEKKRATTSKGVIQQKLLTIKKKPSSSQLQGWPGSYLQTYQIKHKYNRPIDNPINPNPKWTNWREKKIPHIVKEVYYPIKLKIVGDTTAPKFCTLSFVTRN